MCAKNNYARRSVSVLIAVIFALLVLAASSAQAQTTAFTYQGRFSDSSTNPPTINGSYSMRFRLYDADGTDPMNPGNLIASQAATLVSVVNGIFTVRIDFGAAFDTTQNRFLEIQVGTTTLTPRQQVTSAPFSNRAINAATADGLSAACVGCVTNGQIDSVAGSKVTGSVANANFANNATNAQTADVAGNVTGVVAISNGGTGSSAKNFVDLTTNQTVAGNKTFTGTLNGAGVSNLTRIFTFDGLVASIAGNATALIFIGNTVSVTVNANQRVTGVGSAALGKMTADAGTAQIAMCFQSSTGGNLGSLTPGTFLVVQFNTTRASYSVTGSSNSLAAGTYNIGLCVRNSGTAAISNNDYASGWVMVTNN